jgi:hypothetical protein
MRKVQCKPEGFFDKSVRLANGAISVLGTARGLYEVGQTVYGGMQAVGRIGAAMAPAAAIL